MRKNQPRPSPPRPKSKALLAMGPPTEFDCVECGRHVLRFALPNPADLMLCCECVFYPGWFKDDKLAFILDPSGLRNPPPHELDDLGPAADGIVM